MSMYENYGRLASIEESMINPPDYEEPEYEPLPEWDWLEVETTRDAYMLKSWEYGLEAQIDRTFGRVTYRIHEDALNNEIDSETMEGFVDAANTISYMFTEGRIS